MSEALFINSSHWNANTGSFRLNFRTPEKFDGYSVALQSLSIPNSFINVSEIYQNNQITFTFPARWTKHPETGATLDTPVNSWVFNWTLPEGKYDASTLNYFMQQQFQTYRLYTTTGTSALPNYLWEIKENKTFYALQMNHFVVSDTSPSSMIIPEGAGWTWPTITAATPTIQFPQLNMGILLGFIAATNYGGTADKVSYVSSTPKIDWVNSVYIGLNLVSDFRNLPVHLFYQQPVNVTYGLPIVGDPGSPLYRPISPSGGGYHYAEITLHDANGNRIIPKDTGCQFCLALRPPDVPPKR